MILGQIIHIFIDSLNGGTESSSANVHPGINQGKGAVGAKPKSGPSFERDLDLFVYSVKINLMKLNME